MRLNDNNNFTDCENVSLEYYSMSSSILLPHFDDTVPAARKELRRSQRMPNAANGRTPIVGMILLKNSIQKQQQRTTT